MITPTCKEIELCCTNPQHFLKIMRIRYCCVCILFSAFIIAALSSIPLTFLIADYVENGDIDYNLTSTYTNASTSLSNTYHCTSSQMIIDCLKKPISNLCLFIDNSTYKHIDNRTSIEMDRSKYDINYDQTYWRTFDAFAWLGCIFGFFMVIFSFCSQNALQLKCHIYSKLICIICSILGFIFLFIVTLMGADIIEKNQNCEKGMKWFLSQYIINSIDIHINVINVTKHIGESVIFMIILCTLDFIIFVIICIYSQYSDKKNKHRIQRYKHKAESKLNEQMNMKVHEDDVYYCESCHSKGYYYGILFQKIPCVDCRDSSQHLMQHNEATYDAIKSVNA
eukprot:9138_1